MESSQISVNIPNYSGPLEVLLDLAKTQKVNLAEIAITKLADQFLEFIKENENLNLETASEFLLMATWLAYLKSKLLLPEDEGDDFIGITDALKNEVNPSTGLPRYTPLVALSIMVFYVYAAQCMATFAIVKNETNSWKWPLVMIAYMMGLAYIASLMVYQGGQMLGFV